MCRSFLMHGWASSLPRAPSLPAISSPVCLRTWDPALEHTRLGRASLERGHPRPACGGQGEPRRRLGRLQAVQRRVDRGWLCGPPWMSGDGCASDAASCHGHGLCWPHLLLGARTHRCHGRAASLAAPPSAADERVKDWGRKAISMICGSLRS